ncbi:GNAT family N-acetyltransferase [Nocardia sp. NPDC057353]|uniref:GNAT family N-acetyltransferase n=1 Tax=Nocardia sp. NPDC057353 TaxID=3346104 RepID=UPI00364286D8
MPDIALQPLTEGNLPALLAAAVAGADPLEVMAPVPGPAGWTAERRAAFLAFHRGRGLAAEPVELTYVVLLRGAVVGAARLQPAGAGELETGIWLARDARGRGVGRALVTLLRAAAEQAGAARMIATTTPENAAARGLMAGAAVRLADGAVLGTWELG